MRLFVAADIPDDIREALGREMGRCVGCAGLRWVRPSQVHLTLKFLGTMVRKDLQTLADRLEKAAMSHPPMTLTLSGCGAFPSPQRARVFWLGLAGDREEICSLAADIDRRVAGLGVKKEERRFRPHLTLARCRDPQDLRGLLSDWEKWLKGMGAADFQVVGFVLYRSILHPDGPEYIKIEEFRLMGQKRESP